MIQTIQTAATIRNTKAMTVEQARELVQKLGTVVSTVTGRTLFAKVEGDRVVFLGGQSGSHSVAYDLPGVANEYRVSAHWDGYTQDERPAVDALVRYLVVVEGTYSYNDGWESSRVGCVGWVEVEAPAGATSRAIAGLARKNADKAQWEVDGEKVTYNRMREFEVKSTVG